MHNCVWSYCSLLTIAQVLTAVAGSAQFGAHAPTSVARTATSPYAIFAWNTCFILFVYKY